MGSRIDSRRSAVRSPVTGARREGFAEECRRQSRLLRSDRLEADTLAWLEVASDDSGDQDWR